MLTLPRPKPRAPLSRAWLPVKSLVLVLVLGDLWSRAGGSSSSRRADRAKTRVLGLILMLWILAADSGTTGPWTHCRQVKCPGPYNGAGKQYHYQLQIKIHNGTCGNMSPYFKLIVDTSIIHT